MCLARQNALKTDLKPNAQSALTLGSVHCHSLVLRFYPRAPIAYQSVIDDVWDYLINHLEYRDYAEQSTYRPTFPATCARKCRFRAVPVMIVKAPMPVFPANAERFPYQRMRCSYKGFPE